MPPGAAARLLRRWRDSVRSLLVRPGELTRAHAEGRRRRWVPPLALFLGVNVVFFVLQSLLGVATLASPLQSHLRYQFYSDSVRGWVADRQSATGLSPERFEERFNLRQETLAKASVIAMAGAFALLSALLWRGRRRRLGHHLVHALHFYAFVLLALTASTLATALAQQALGLLGSRPDWRTADAVATAALGLVFWTWLALSARRAFDVARWWAWLSSAALTACVLLLVLLHRFAVFAVTAALL